MPDPVLILQAMAAASLTAAAILLGSAGWRRPGDSGRAAIGWPLAMGAGFLAGAVALGQRPGTLPGTDKDRLLLLVVPLAMMVESLVAAARPAPGWRWLARLALAAALTPLLLQGTVYLAVGDVAGADSWTTSQRLTILGGIAGALVIVWLGMVTLYDRGRTATVWTVLALTSGAVGISTMLSGYLSAGMLALPLAATCGTVAVVGRGALGHAGAGGVVVGLVCLASILVMGRFFGALSTLHALLLAAAPLLGWIGETSVLRGPRPCRGPRDPASTPEDLDEPSPP